MEETERQDWFMMKQTGLKTESRDGNERKGEGEKPVRGRAFFREQRVKPAGDLIRRETITSEGIRVL